MERHGDHFLRVLIGDEQAEGAYYVGGWDIRYESQILPLVSWQVSGHERMHALLTEHTAWGAILMLSADLLRGDLFSLDQAEQEKVRRSLSDFVEANRDAQEMFATYISLARSEPEKLTRSGGVLKNATYQRYLDMALHIAPALPIASHRHQAVVTAVALLAMQPAALHALMGSTPPWELAKVRRRDHPDWRLRQILQILAEQWDELVCRANIEVPPIQEWHGDTGSVEAQQRFQTEDNYKILGRYTDFFYRALSEILAAAGSPSMGRFEHADFTSRLLAEVRAAGLAAADVMAGGDLPDPPPGIVKFVTAAQERIWLKPLPMRAQWLEWDTLRVAEFVAEVIESGSSLVITVRPPEDWVADYLWSAASLAVLSKYSGALAAICIAVEREEFDGCDLVVIGVPSPRQAKALQKKIGRGKVVVNMSCRFLLLGKLPGLRAFRWMLLHIPKFFIIDVELNYVALYWLMNNGSVSLRATGLPDPEYAHLSVLVGRYILSYMSSSHWLWVGVCGQSTAADVMATLRDVFGENLGSPIADEELQSESLRATVQNLLDSRPYVGFTPMRRTVPWKT
ncbi:hypothetical protein [Streptomyces scabiei]|uniref:hypothetical protein n=1 Tax=Streptomyces scabiei TaxID=1930 RepID=UPI00131B3E73|nr:hypothetical protein [Streptomyces scabiei]